MIVHARAWTPAVLAVSLSTAACGNEKPAAKPSGPATVAHGVSEASLTTVTLTPDAARRLGIETAVVEARGVTRTRTLGADVVAASGAQTTVTAPVAGTLEPGDAAARPGDTVRRGATLARLVPLSPGERDVRVEAERAVNEARGRQELAAQRSQRALRLAETGAGSRRAAEEAAADLVVANAALKAAQDRLALAATGVSASGGLALPAPFDAVILAVHAVPGQRVAGSAPVVDLVRLDPVWVRVPLFAGDSAGIDRTALARLVPLGAASDAAGAVARPVTAPPSADPSTAAIDVYYAVENRDGRLRPGERVAVRVPLAGAATGAVVTTAALLHDAYGGTWVYEARSATEFMRRRVSVVDRTGDLAVLDQGPPPGTKVVTAGAAELFGTEFGVGK